MLKVNFSKHLRKIEKCCRCEDSQKIRLVLSSERVSPNYRIMMLFGSYV